jgi:hypothetical protein
MRFGLFVPEGWRLDLVGVDPARARLRRVLWSSAAAEQGGDPQVK